MDRYMLVAMYDNNENNNLEIIEYDLTEEEVNELKKEYETKSGVESLYICKHTKLEYQKYPGIREFNVIKVLEKIKEVGGYVDNTVRLLDNDENVQNVDMEDFSTLYVDIESEPYKITYEDNSDYTKDGRNTLRVINTLEEFE